MPQDLDQFYTRTDVALRLTKIFTQLVGEPDLFLEPSAGKGAFVEALIKEGVPTDKIRSMDIQPGSSIYKVEEYDYLNTNFAWCGKRIAVLGNPPFGKQGTMARQFLLRSCEFATHVGFILPYSFSKKSNQSFVPSNYHLVLDLALEPLSFELPDGSPRAVRTTFQVWERRGHERLINDGVLVQANPFLEFSNNPYLEAEFIMLRCGGNAGKVVDLDTELDKNGRYKWYLKEKRQGVRKLLESERVQAHLAIEAQKSSSNKSLSRSDVVSVLAGLRPEQGVQCDLFEH